MKLSFPAYFVLTFGLFAAYILVLVTKTYYVNNELVSEDYYQQELDYQQKINKMKHAGEIAYHWNGAELVIRFPTTHDSSTIKGQLVFYRPSDSSKDLTVPIHLSGREQHFHKNLFAKGSYKIKIDWRVGDQDYYTEKDLQVF